MFLAKASEILISKGKKGGEGPAIPVGGGKRVKNRIITGLIVALMLISLSGCDSMYKKEFLSVSEYSGSSGDNVSDISQITGYAELKDAILTMVISHKAEGRLTFSDYGGSLQSDLAKACTEVKAEYAVASYAVNYMSYDISRIATYYEATFYITYKHTQSELAAVRYVSCETELVRALGPALDAMSADLTVSATSETITAEEITRAVNRAYADDPASCVVQPNATIAIYPESGLNRIIDIKLEYGWKQSELKKMKSTLKEKIEDISGKYASYTNSVYALNAFNALTEACNYDPSGLGRDKTELNSGLGSTAYGALSEGYADSKGMAFAFSALCHIKGIECYVVSGTMDKLNHSWNIVKLEGSYYHIDASAKATLGIANAFMKNDSQMRSRYEWKAEDYPVCSGVKTYSDILTLAQ